MTETVPKFTLKALRVNKKKTQQEIADYLEVNLRTYQKYEKDPDTMSLGNAKKLAKHYGISLDLLS
nr:helix-turn-helix transcriptional regulator [Catenibacterium mitsuokai]DAZ04814.1 MAG TPA: Helix-turn-helix XRE-family like protein [Caudoviricetes sp.]